jgi:hypothetical protein
MNKRWLRAAGVLLACLMVLGVTTSTFAQGRGRGGGGGGGGGGRGMGGGSTGIGRSTGAGGVDRGINTSSERSNGRSDRGRENASTRSEGRSDEGLNRARMASANSRRADEDLNRHPGIARGLNMSANELRGAYQTALQINPDLKFGQFVAATRLSRNLGTRYPNITREAILAGLGEGRSLGQTLRDLGLGSDEAKEAERRVKRQMKESMRQP